VVPAADDGLAIKATAYILRDLMDYVKEKTPAAMRKSYSPEQLTAVAYNVGTKGMQETFAMGHLGKSGQPYSDSVMSYYYGSSDKAICHSGLYTC